MQRFLAFIPRKWRLAPWQVLLGAAATVAWWGFMLYSIPLEDLRKDPRILFVAALVIPAWLLYGAIIVAIRWVSAHRPVVVRALVEIAAFAAMVGVAMLVTYLFPERHFWHGEVSSEFNFSPLVFAATLVCEVAMYIAARFLYARAPVAVKEPKPLSAYRPEREIDSGERQEAATDPGSYPAPSYEVGEAREAVPTEREIVRVDARRWPFVTLGNVSFAVAVVLIGSYLLMALGPQENTGSEDKSLRIAPTVPATVDQKLPAECVTAKNAEECADTLQKLGKNWWDAYPDAPARAGNVPPAERSIRASGHANEIHEYERMADTVRHGDQATWERIGILWDHLAAEGCTMAHAIWICPETPPTVRAQMLRLQRKHNG